jgi:hypothetical protein
MATANRPAAVSPATTIPRVEGFPDPTVCAVCAGVPVYAYGYTHVLAASPALVESASLQVGNTTPLQKLRLKKSAEIGFNQLGGTTPRMPRTPANDYRPLEPVHLIDGDPTTCWSSRSVAQPEAEPAWIRIDLPVERPISRVTLRKRVPGAPRNLVGSMSPDQGAVEVGMGMPGALTVQVSRDAMNWETVFDGESGDTPDRREFVCSFPARPAKQIWISGRRLARVENWHFAFSIAAVEVADSSGANLALVSRGAGVTVSSTLHSFGQTREEHHLLWPLFTDLGLKWARVGYHDDPINWHWVEKEKGKLAVDPEADAAITYLVERGVDIVLALGFGNRLYTQEDPSRRLPQLWEWYYENPAPPVTPVALAAWGRYVRFMCRQFRDRVKVFEIWNEWNIPVYWGAAPDLDHYLALARIAIPIIREECPEAQVMLGSVAGFCSGMARQGAEALRQQPGPRLFLGAVQALARDVDLIGWHPFYQTDSEAPAVREYVADIRAFRLWCEAQGFHGGYLASEYNWGANYPLPAKPHWWGACVCSELQKAKYVARLSVLHTALGIGSFFCEVWGNPLYPLDLSLLRRAFNADPITPLQPQAAYYVMRNLATALDGYQPACFEHAETGVPADLEGHAMARPGELALALWLPGPAVDDCAGTPADLRVLGTFARVSAYDCLTGLEQDLLNEVVNGSTLVRGLIVKDYPMLVRFAGGRAP